MRKRSSTFTSKSGVSKTMTPSGTPVEFLTIASIMLVMLLNCHRALIVDTEVDDEDDSDVDDTFPNMHDDRPLVDVHDLSIAALRQWTLWHNLTILDNDLGFWVKPRSTAWFSKFLFKEYDDARWISIFRMSKRSVILLSSFLAPTIQRSNTRYRLCVPVIVCVGCALFKLCQGASLLISSELFAVGKSTVSVMLRDVVGALNQALRSKISWPTGDRLSNIAEEFKLLCGLPAVVGAIDGTHFAIAKPRLGSADYFHFRTGAYSITCQVVVDSAKRFLDINVGMLGLTHDSRVLRRSALYHRGQRGDLWLGRPTISGFTPYLLGDAGYPVLPWLMVPHRRHERLSPSQRLFNRKLSKGRAMVENSFGMLKQGFRKLNRKSDLNVAFMPDVVVACALLHNVLLHSSHEEVEQHFASLIAGRQRQLDHEDEFAPVTKADLPDHLAGQIKRNDLGVYLTLQRGAPY